MQKLSIQKLLFSIFSLFIYPISYCLSQELVDKSKQSLNLNDKAENKYDFFDPLPTTKEIIKKDQLGKVDPFSLNSQDEIINKFGAIKLLGVFSANKKNYALLQYKNLTGDILEGSIGGKDTNLLPDKVLLKEIKIKKSEIVLIFKNNEYRVKLK